MGNRLHLKPVATSSIGLAALFEKHATATAGPVLISLVQFGFWSFFGPMDRTFKHYLQGHSQGLWSDVAAWVAGQKVLDDGHMSDTNDDNNNYID